MAKHGLLAHATEREVPPAEPPNEVWPLPGGTAWVYWGQDHSRVERPVIFADGFGPGETELKNSWDWMERLGYPMASNLLARGHDLIILGYDRKTARIQDNAEVAIACIREARDAEHRTHRLAVGGFSMGGLVTRFALAKMEKESERHDVAVYVSYDSPHTGAWIPIGLQAFAHFVKDIDSKFYDLIMSDAAKQLLSLHLPSAGGTPGETLQRATFLTELRNYGWWPSQPDLYGVSNGRRDGTGNGIDAGVEAMRVTGPDRVFLGPFSFKNTALITQATGKDRLVAHLESTANYLNPRRVTTSDLPELDGAPGGTLDGFLSAAAGLASGGQEVVCPITDHCFVPAISAVAAGDPLSQDALYAPITNDDSELKEFECADENEFHTLPTEKLCTWIFDRLP